MKRIFTFSVILFLLLANDKSYSQSANWGNWSSISCYKGFQFATKNYGYVKTINQYSWQAKIKSNYNKKVSFNMSWTVGGEKVSIGQVTLNPGQEYSHTSRYFNSNANGLYLEVSDVCFGNNWVSCKGCFANCDNGSPNQPDCGNSSTSSNQTKNNSNQESNSFRQELDNLAYQRSQEPQNRTNNQQEQLAKQKNDEEFESKTGTWVEYGQRANSSAKSGDYESAIKYAKLQVSASANDAQRENAQLWLNEYTKANQNAGSQNLAMQQEQQRQQEVQQQELKRQEDAKRTAAYIDLGVQTIKSVSGLISSLKEEKRERLEQAREKERADNIAKNEEILIKLNTIYSEFTKTNDKKKAEQMGDLLIDLASNPKFYEYKKYENTNIPLYEKYRESANLWYIKSIELGNIPFSMVKKVLDYYGDKYIIKIDSVRQKKFTEVFSHITKQFNKYKEKGDMTMYFDFAKTYANSNYYRVQFEKYDIRKLIEYKNQEKYWLDKATELDHPQALAVTANYYDLGDFFYEKNIEKFNFYNQKAKKHNIEVTSKNCQDNISSISLTLEEINQLNDLSILKDYKKVKSFFVQLSTKYGFHFIEEKSYSKQYGKNVHSLYFQEFWLIYRDGKLVLTPYNFKLVKFFGNQSFFLSSLTGGTYSGGSFLPGSLSDTGTLYGDLIGTSNIRGYAVPYEISFDSNSGIPTTSNEINEILGKYTDLAIPPNK